MTPYRYLLVILLFFTSSIAYCQQDVDFHVNARLLGGKKVLKVKRDFNDPYLWALTANNGVYRINSVTLAVDDYSAQFSAYNNVQFTDIAGRSKDSVYIAASANMIQFEKGTLKIIGQPDGLTGTINELGFDHLFENIPAFPYRTIRGMPTLLIATSTGMFTYNFVSEALTATAAPPIETHLYETTYRNTTFSNLSFSTGYDPTKTSAVINWTRNTTYQGDLWYNTPELGYHIYTAYFSNASYLSDENTFSVWNNVEYMNELWGTETGLFETEWDESYFTLRSPYHHYLTGIKVNKVTSIYGLVNFGSESLQGLTKETFLVGTDSGFYFSNSSYLKYVGGFLRDDNAFTFNADIGNQVINDVCVNATSYTVPLCEDGVWVAATDGLYYLKPDYGKYINSQTIQAATFQGMSDTASATKICAGSSVTGLIKNDIYNGNSIQWYKDGQQLPAESKDSLVINSAGDYYAVLYDPCSITHLETNHLKVDVINGPVFYFNYPNLIQQCNNNPDTLKTDINPGYHYQWYTNGVLNGDTTASYIVTQSGKYKVEVSACTNSWVPSKEIEVDMISLPVPQLSADKSVYCAQDIASLSVNVPIDPAYIINWYRNSNLLTNDNNLTTIQETIAGDYTVIISSNISTCTQTSLPLQLAFTPSPVFTFNYPAKLQYCIGTPLTLAAIGNPNYQYRWYKNGTLTGDVTAALSISQPGKYNVEVSACAGSWIPSTAVQVDFIQLPVPAISTDKPTYCMGDNATLSVAITPNPAYTVNWYLNNALLTANTNQSSVTTNAAGNYTVSVVSNRVNTDGTTCSQTSVVQPLLFNPLPTVNIQKIVTTTICDGQTIYLLAHYNGGTVKWSTGETSDQIGVTEPGNYTATVRSLAGCQVSSVIAVAFLPTPVFKVKDTSVCSYKHEAVTLTAPPGFSNYSWNGLTGSQTYQVSFPQTVNLIITDANGCQTSQQIKVADQCPNVLIPNAFTPNGDGTNDTWVISGIGDDPTLLIKVYSRYGTQIYQSRGNYTPWNGQYRGKHLPQGVYYYIITAKKGTQTFSGSLTIIY